MVVKTSNPSGKRNKRPNKVNNDTVTTVEEKKIELIFLGEYFNIYTMQYHPVTKKFIERESQRLREWALLDTSLRLVDFIDGAGYPPETFYGWCAQYQEMEMAHLFALRRIGSRREDGAITRKFEASTIHRTLGYYDNVWAQETVKIAQMKEKLAQAENKIIVIEKFALTDADSPTPEEVGALAHKKTRDDRVIGPCIDRRKE